MSLEKKRSISPRLPPQNDRGQTPSPIGLRHRSSLRTMAAANMKDSDRLNRRSSFFSETFSDTNRSIRTTTDDLFLPRVTKTTSQDDQIETSHWHSVPLVLALLPAVGGLFFQNGSHVVTDITLLVIAAVFLNWALRLPWEWYKAAQATVTFEDDLQASSLLTDDEDEASVFDSKEEIANGKPDDDLLRARAAAAVEISNNDDIRAAQKELRLHEMLALFACFVFPAFGAWLLHNIRGQLSRPSEGLVSNYNLTIFLLVAEIRPLSHLIKLVQRRTLFLQRKVNNKILQGHRLEQKQDMTSFAKRLEDLETHVTDKMVDLTNGQSQPGTTPDALASQAAAEAGAQLRKTFQPEVEALNRAMRRYEKRMTITAVQVEARLQDLENRLRDVVSLAAAAQRSADRQPHGYTATLFNWMSAILVVPVRYCYHLLGLPLKFIRAMLEWLKSTLRLNRRIRSRDANGIQRSTMQKGRVPQKKTKGIA